jgi:mono/diheme cytochrome c family protein
VWLCAGFLLYSQHAALAAQASTEQGAAVYQLRCSGCHGENLINLSGGWSFDLRKLRPDQHDQFVLSVISGRENMPSWYGILKTEEIEAIWTYIRATVDR